MEAKWFTWADLAPDMPVPYLTRRKVTGDKMLVAQIRLEKGCLVASHRHESEQMSVILSGRMRWSLGEPGTPEHREVELAGGQVLELPSNFYHGVVEVIEDVVVIDILSPPGMMGVDRQPAPS